MDTKQGPREPSSQPEQSVTNLSYIREEEVGIKILPGVGPSIYEQLRLFLCPGGPHTRLLLCQTGCV